MREVDGACQAEACHELLSLRFFAAAVEFQFDACVDARKLIIPGRVPFSALVDGVGKRNGQSVRKRNVADAM